MVYESDRVHYEIGSGGRETATADPSPRACRARLRMTERGGLAFALKPTEGL